jgi:Set1/Ash2 histone methyltransferase complex subunit ASH2
MFNYGPDFEIFHHDFNERPIPKPMVEVPHHGFDNQVENGVAIEKKSNEE